MLLDKILFDKIGVVGKSIMDKAGLKHAPSNIEEMYQFLSKVKESIEKQDFDGILIGSIFYSFVTSLEVRDRQTTSRIFEDIFSALFSLKATDVEKRNNPKPSKELLKFDKYNTQNDDFKISTDIVTNKREKADVFIDNYGISLKTLQGIAYDEDGRKMHFENDKDNKDNNEVNVGSFSYRALLKGIVDEQLSDRKNGLGSGKQIREKVLNKIKIANKEEEFKERLDCFMKFVYEDDVYLVLKGNYRITFYLIPANSFVDCIIKIYEYDEENFEKTWYRWENNNLRLHWKPILQYCQKYELIYKKIEINLAKAVQNEKIIKFKNEIGNYIENKIEELM